jgi:hypothetical protein
MLDRDGEAKEDIEPSFVLGLKYSLFTRGLAYVFYGLRRS